jgi:hypothetical protein
MLLVPRLELEAVAGRLEEWRRLLRQSITQGRAVLQRVIRRRLTFTPDGASYAFRGETPGSTGCSRAWWSPKGPRGLWTATHGSGRHHRDDTFEAEYGRMLDRLARVLGNALGAGFEPAIFERVRQSH